MPDIKKLEIAIGYSFKDRNLLMQALTHSSYANEFRLGKTGSNERLEFLGDAALELISSEFFFNRYKDEPEGYLTKTRASFVCEPALAYCADVLNLGMFLRLGKGEASTGGRLRASVLSDALEALIGAVYLDGGFASAKELVLKVVLNDINFSIQSGEIVALIGKNGAGKSTLASILVGNPKHKLIDGDIILDGENINDDTVDERAKKGIFLSFQYPEEIPGLTVEDFLRTAKEAVTGEKQYLMQFHNELEEKMEKLHINPEYAQRHLNVGFSGGEKKKNEILQMAVLEPKLAILDETDSGLDIDATKIVFEGVQKLKTNDTALLIITHYDKVLDYLDPDFVHILMDGKIVRTGGKEIVEEIEKNGYGEMKKQFGL